MRIMNYPAHGKVKSVKFLSGEVEKTNIKIQKGLFILSVV